jgi:hypothetical protein
MRTLLAAARIAAFFFAIALAVAPTAAPAVKLGVFEGNVVHVSTDNIKVKDAKTGKVMAYLLVPHFNRVFSKDGKTTKQMSALTPGTPVTVYYTQTLGVRHADRILINGSVKTLHG